MIPHAIRNPYTVFGLLLLALAACNGLTEPTAEIPYAPNPVTEAAAQQALACGVAHGLTVKRPISSLRLFLSPGYPISVGESEVAAYSAGGKIWVASPLAGEERVWAHEFLHEIYGLPGMTRAEHPPVFAACGLLDI